MHDVSKETNYIDCIHSMTLTLIGLVLTSNNAIFSKCTWKVVEGGGGGGGLLTKFMCIIRTCPDWIMVLYYRYRPSSIPSRYQCFNMAANEKPVGVVSNPGCILEICSPLKYASFMENKKRMPLLNNGKQAITSFYMKKQFCLLNYLPISSIPSDFFNNNLFLFVWWRTHITSILRTTP